MLASAGRPAGRSLSAAPDWRAATSALAAAAASITLHRPGSEGSALAQNMCARAAPPRHVCPLLRAFPPRRVGEMAAAMQEVFPDALSPLKEADPELWTLVQKEKERQWCASPAAACRDRRCARRARATRPMRHAAQLRPRCRGLQTLWAGKALAGGTADAMRRCARRCGAQEGHRADRQRELHVGGRDGGARLATDQQVQRGTAWRTLLWRQRSD